MAHKRFLRRAQYLFIVQFSHFFHFQISLFEQFAMALCTGLQLVHELVLLTAQMLENGALLLVPRGILGLLSIFQLVLLINRIRQCFRYWLAWRILVEYANHACPTCVCVSAVFLFQRRHQRQLRQRTLNGRVNVALDPAESNVMRWQCCCCCCFRL